MAQMRETRFSDVCGTVDELKRLMSEEPEAGSQADRLVGFVEDCVYMIGRMDLRLREFQRLRDEVAQLSQQMLAIPDSRSPYAEQVAATMVSRLRQGRVLSTEEAAALSEQAEEVRGVAGEQEQLLRRFKEACMGLGALCRAIEGNRGWGRDSSEAETAGLEAGLTAWLPAPPHRGKILDFLQRDRARLLPREESQVPLVQFEDGGVIALSAVRWSDAVSNFVPASFDPSPRANRYRLGEA
jgi:hypothetical protein